jgi:hypothetical protein
MDFIIEAISQTSKTEHLDIIKLSDEDIFNYLSNHIIITDYTKEKCDMVLMLLCQHELWRSAGLLINNDNYNYNYNNAAILQLAPYIYWNKIYNTNIHAIITLYSAINPTFCEIFIPLCNLSINRAESLLLFYEKRPHYAKKVIAQYIAGCKFMASIRRNWIQACITGYN